MTRTSTVLCLAAAFELAVSLGAQTTTSLVGSDALKSAGSGAGNTGAAAGAAGAEAASGVARVWSCANA